MLSFNFGGKNSSSDFDIIISKRPVIPSPKRRVTYIDIPGRSSSVRYDEKTYEDITILVECSIKDKENLAEKIDGIKGWLFNAGEGDLIFSFQEDRKYIGQVVNAIDFAQFFKYTSRFPIVFNCRPFKHAIANTLATITQSGTIINNPGSLESAPVISVYGSGDITININGREVQLYSITDKIIINSEIMDCYDDALSNLNTKMAGEFPILDTGDNTITFTGSVTKLEVLPNWRWL